MRLPLACATLALAAACSDANPAKTPADPASATITLTPMRFEEYASVVPPNLSCAFKADGGILLVASAPDDRAAEAAAVLKVDNALVRMTRSAAGGYRGLLDPSSTFQGRGYEVVIDRSAGEGRRDGVETTVWPASLTLQDADGRSRLTGTWNCGA